MKTISEQIAEFEATRVSKSAEMSAIMDKASEDGSTLDAEQSEAFDTLEGEVGAIDKHLSRLKAMQKSQAQSAKPVGTENVIKTIDNSGMPQVRAKNTQKLEPGIAFARAAKCPGTRPPGTPRRDQHRQIAFRWPRKRDRRYSASRDQGCCCRSDHHSRNLGGATRW